jgi:hypothetical protein
MRAGLIDFEVKALLPYPGFARLVCQDFSKTGQPVAGDKAPTTASSRGQVKRRMSKSPALFGRTGFAYLDICIVQAVDHCPWLAFPVPILYRSPRWLGDEAFGGSRGGNWKAFGNWAQD